MELERSPEQIAVFGGVYSNYIALEAVLADIRSRGISRIYCLGDLGAFGPHPDRIFPLLVDSGVATVQGNYDHSIGHRRDDCACGYTDPRDNHFARLSYAYTYERTPDHWKDWLRDLPPSIDIDVAGLPMHLCHGSPRQTNEFLWESTTPDPFIRRLFDSQKTRAIFCTHTGLHWFRAVTDSWLINVGAIGRPENDGSPQVSYTIVTVDPAAPPAAQIQPKQVRIDYDHAQLAREMRAEGLPEEFVATIETGWWSSCLEILPVKERIRGQY